MPRDIPQAAAATVANEQAVFLLILAVVAAAGPGAFAICL